MSLFGPGKTVMVSEAEALPGRAAAMAAPGRHVVLGAAMAPPFPDGMAVAVFGMGCFWGAERLFWPMPGVHVTSVGYAGGFTPNPTYDEVCTARTGHAEVVMVVYDPAVTGYEALLRRFWEGHNPTQGMRQGNDIGTQYRSVILVTSPEQERLAGETLALYQERLSRSGFGAITTRIAALGPYYWAEPYHQQYLARNPGGYCGLGGTGIRLTV
ncbi:peptide-methionine (S)-S-oxide reductase MsrA [Magnetospirillum sp. SS-4]|uniref:peptide-methionine (S)-S-oxide reductase MsrA n=1 Tax=Magnetospirillum sp. SS-4 TaxID=2681465 RepID=UPI0013826278|nr:peptide-methionine (S)-S-oxide reductase MsrA [Magnetospirillum sp. SS-4]CAA7624908.1 methionine sulfoxide reductase A [Magnetospirillum sp. SS-4]